ncbi:hypothetical protein EYF80_008894 [Liparis tanakae]|uniref:Uncharacterized protein n=1 Tax=Liparis tanakae TaxID=230148 RepID=A0A4Z2ISA8_9TELE|nr:hypothetical protein EYF80_008894 [Liparis tanakae]
MRVNLSSSRLRPPLTQANKGSIVRTSLTTASTSKRGERAKPQSLCGASGVSERLSGNKPLRPQNGNSSAASDLKTHITVNKHNPPLRTYIQAHIAVNMRAVLYELLLGYWATECNRASAPRVRRPARPLTKKTTVVLAALRVDSISAVGAAEVSALQRAALWRCDKGLLGGNRCLTGPARYSPQETISEGSQ